MKPPGGWAAKEPDTQVRCAPTLLIAQLPIGCRSRVCAGRIPLFGHPRGWQGGPLRGAARGMTAHRCRRHCLNPLPPQNGITILEKTQLTEMAYFMNSAGVPV